MSGRRNKAMKVHVFNRNGHLVGPIEVAPVVKSDAQWRALLTPNSSTSLAAKVPRGPFAVICSIINNTAFMRPSVVGYRRSRPRPSSTRERVGLVSSSRWRRGMSSRTPIAAMGWCGWKLSRAVANVIWGTFFPMAHHRRMNVTASTANR
jgi:hypothetical protein